MALTRRDLANVDDADDGRWCPFVESARGGRAWGAAPIYVSCYREKSDRRGAVDASCTTRRPARLRRPADVDGWGSRWTSSRAGLPGRSTRPGAAGGPDPLGRPRGLPNEVGQDVLTAR